MSEEHKHEWVAMTLCGECETTIRKRELTAKDERIAELEKWLSRSLGDCPCEHAPEDDVNSYPNCSYCKMQVDAMKALADKE